MLALMGTIYVRAVPEDQHAWLQREARKRDLSVAQFVRALIARDYALSPRKFADIPVIRDGAPAGGEPDAG